MSANTTAGKMKRQFHTKGGCGGMVSVIAVVIAVAIVTWLAFN